LAIVKAAVALAPVEDLTVQEAIETSLREKRTVTLEWSDDNRTELLQSSPNWALVADADNVGEYFSGVQNRAFWSVVLSGVPFTSVKVLGLEFQDFYPSLFEAGATALIDPDGAIFVP